MRYFNYLINGKEAQGDDYVAALDALEAIPCDDLGWVHVKIPEADALIIYHAEPNGFTVTDERLDGASWTSPTLNKHRVKDLIHSFLNRRNDWRDGIEWDLLTFSRRDARHRMRRLLLVCAVFAVMAWGLVKLLYR